MILQDRKDTIARVPLGLVTWLNFPSHHGIAAAANMGLDAVCMHTGTFGLRRERPRPADHAAERVIDAAHRAGLEVLAWVPDPATLSGSRVREPTRSVWTTSPACSPL